MNGFKSMIASRTVWAAAISVLASLIGMLGYTITAEMQSEITLLVTQAVSVIASGIAVYGRVTATKKIG